MIDTRYIINKYNRKDQISKDPDKPYDIDHHSQYMVCDNSSKDPDNQGTADLVFYAHPGDYVSFRATSVDQNSGDAVILYGIQYNSEDGVCEKPEKNGVFGKPVINVVTEDQIVQPDPTKENGLPPNLVTQSFTSLDVKVNKKGTENFKVCIALYTTELTEEGELKQQLHSYYRWDPAIIVI